MQAFAEREIASAAFANLSEVGVRKLMVERGATALQALKADVEGAVRGNRAGLAPPFDPRASEPRAFRFSWGAG